MKTLQLAKAHAAAMAAALHPGAAAPTAAQAPTIGTSWQGANDSRFTPPDANGAIGPNSFVEVVNSKIAIYQRNGTLTATALFSRPPGLPRRSSTRPFRSPPFCLYRSFRAVTRFSPVRSWNWRMRM